MLIFQRWEIGVLEALVRPDVLPLFAGAWIFLLLGIGVQLLLLKTCRRWGRWAMVSLTLLAVVICEVGLRMMGGWDGVLFAVGIRLLWYLLLGAGLGWLFWYFKKKN